MMTLLIIWAFVSLLFFVHYLIGHLKFLLVIYLPNEVLTRFPEAQLPRCPDARMPIQLSDPKNNHPRED